VVWITCLPIRVGCTNTSLDHVSYGAVRYDEGRDSQAVSGKTKVVEINPSLSRAHYNQGVFHATEGRYDLVISDYDHAIEADPEYALTYFARATAYHKQGKYDLAFSDYDQAIVINPMYAATYNNRESPTLIKAGTTGPSQIIARRSRSILNFPKPTTILRRLMTKKASMMGYS
jgi:tetratricopeptide (TPR) repeat protein